LHDPRFSKTVSNLSSALPQSADYKTHSAQKNQILGQCAHGPIGTPNQYALGLYLQLAYQKGFAPNCKIVTSANFQRARAGCPSFGNKSTNCLSIPVAIEIQVSIAHHLRSTPALLRLTQSDYAALSRLDVNLNWRTLNT